MRGAHDRISEFPGHSAYPRQGTKTARPHAEKCSDMGHARPGRIDGHHHVAHGREEAANTAEVRDAIGSESGSARSEPGEDRRASEPNSGIAARAAGCAESTEQALQRPP